MQHAYRYSDADEYELYPPHQQQGHLSANDPFQSGRTSQTSMEEKLPLGAAPAATPPMGRSAPMGQFDSDHNLVAYSTPEGYAYKPPAKKSNRKWWILLGVLAAIAVIVGAVLGGVLGTRKKSTADHGNDKAAGDNGGSSSSNSDSSGTASTGAPSATPSNAPVLNAASGGDGSEVTMDSGDKFVYSNKFGGTWAVDPSNPYGTSGQAQTWTPRLNETWQWGKTNIRGVNLGGWLVTEPFIAPGLYEQYQKSTPKAVDEYTLSQAMGADLPTKMEEHYKTFITEKDFADIAAAGLNWVRIPLGFWAVETQSEDPYLPKVSWTYFTKAVGWARKYGLRIMLDLHALPGSQNGWNHSGKGGTANWMYGVMGIANAERSLEIIRSLVQYISQDGIKEVVPMMGIVNEVMASSVGMGPLGSFYYQAYDIARKSAGYGAGNGPIIAFHDGFLNIDLWSGFLSGADRLALDEHLYLAFTDINQNQNGIPAHAASACSWGGGTNSTQSKFGIVVGGEWSIAISDCGFWLNGVDDGTGYEYSGYAKKFGSCTQNEEWMKWDDTMKSQLQDYAMATMDALQNWFFWTWHIGNSTTLGYAPSPMWHYQLGLQQGWLPADPRAAGGWCKRNHYCEGCYEFDFNYPASATGAAPSATIAADQLASYAQWPPAAIGYAPSLSFTGDQVKLLPTLTKTGTPLTLATPTPSVSGAGNGWANAQDTAGAYVTVAGCSYFPEYDANSVALPTAACTGA